MSNKKSHKNNCPAHMYITDLTRFLDSSGAIGQVKGPALAMAQFQVGVVAHASDSAPESFLASRCFRCKKADAVALKAADDTVI